MLRFLMLLAALCVSLISGQAQENRPQAGEIALEGRISSFDVVNNIVVLRAVSFTDATGKRTSLPVPKDKTLLARETTIVLNSRGKVASWGDLGKDEEIVAIGRDDGKYLRVRLVVWHSREMVVPDPDSPPDIAPLLPAPQGAFGVALRPIDAGWSRESRILGEQHSELPTFFVKWKLAGPKPAGENFYGGALDRDGGAQLLRMSGPNGEFLALNGERWTDNSHPEFSILTLAHNDINPAWPFLNAEWEIRDPTEAGAALGQLKTELKMEKLPIPRKTGDSIDIKRDFLTQSGATLHLERVERVSDEEHGPRLTFHLHWTPSDKAPDVTLETIGENTLSAPGTDWKPTSLSAGAMGENISFDIVGTPPESALTLTLETTLFERSVALKDRSKFRTVRFQIPVAPAWKMRPLERQTAPFLAAETPDFALRLENQRRNGNNWNGLLWIQDRPRRETVVPGSWRWIVRAAHAVKSNGQTSIIYLNRWEERRRFLHLDSTPAAPDESAQLLFKSLDPQWVKDGEPFALQLKLERAQRLEYFGTLRDIKVPRAGPVQEEKTSDLDDIVRVRRVVSYRDWTMLPGVSEGWKRELKSTGMAIVIEISAQFPDAEIAFRTSGTFDAAGRHWSEGLESFHALPGDKTRPGDDNPRFRTLFLPAFGSATTQFSLPYHIIETHWSGQSQTVTLRDVGASNPPIHP